jgi:transposase-like protein
VRSLVARGVKGVQLVVSDALQRLTQAIARVLSCPWQRCTVHFLRDCLDHARRDQHGLLGALIRPIRACPGPWRPQSRRRSPGRLASPARGPSAHPRER